MNHFYFDESIHQRAGFILGAYVFGPDADSTVATSLQKCGLRPDIDEYKSSFRMVDHAEQIALRDELRMILRAYRIGVLVMPSVLRESLGEEALRGLDQFARMNSLATERFTASFDRNVFSSTQRALELVTELGISAYCDVRPEQDSRIVKGIQLADYVAHSCSTMLLESLGLIGKKVKAGAHSGYDPEMEIDLGFELWAGLRYQFFFAGAVSDQDPIYGGALMNVGLHGLYIAKACSENLRRVADQRFGQCYLGCIH